VALQLYETANWSFSAAAAVRMISGTSWWMLVSILSRTMEREYRTSHIS